MTELNGLAHIIGNAGTLHGIEEPPDRSAYEHYGDYVAAHRAWYLRTHYWHATVTKP